MRKFVMILTFMLGFNSLQYAQVQGGIKAGFNYSNMVVSSLSGSFDNGFYSAKPGYSAGVFTKIPVKNSIGLNIETLFSNKGYVFNSNGEKETENLNYINWLILFYYNPSSKFDLEIGPELGYLMVSKELIRNFDLGVSAGVNYAFSRYFHLGIRYCMGIPFNFKEQEHNYINEIKGSYSNSVIELSVGFNLLEVLESNKENDN